MKPPLPRNLAPQSAKARVFALATILSPTDGLPLRRPMKNHLKTTECRKLYNSSNAGIIVYCLLWKCNVINMGAITGDL